MVLVAAYGGFRFGELAGLRATTNRPDRYRADRGDMRRSSWRPRVGAPKTEAGRRSVALPSFVASALRDHQATYSQAGPDGLVFTAPEGGPLRRSNYRHKVWLPAIACAGLDGFRFHDLRHTAVVRT
jgi:integrase